jgi:hypothetical protein
VEGSVLGMHRLNHGNCEIGNHIPETTDSVLLVYCWLSTGLDGVVRPGRCVAGQKRVVVDGLRWLVRERETRFGLGLLPWVDGWRKEKSNKWKGKEGGKENRLSGGLGLRGVCSCFIKLLH